MNRRDFLKIAGLVVVAPKTLVETKLPFKLSPTQKKIIKELGTAKSKLNHRFTINKNHPLATGLIAFWLPSVDFHFTFAN